MTKPNLANTPHLGWSNPPVSNLCRQPKNRTTSRPWLVINFRSGRWKSKARSIPRKLSASFFEHSARVGKGIWWDSNEKKEGQEGQNPRQPMSNVQCPASISSYAPRLDLMGFRVPQRMCPIPAHPVQFHSVRLLRQIPYSVPVPCSLRRSPSHRLDWLQDFRGICLGPLYVSNFVLFPCPCRWRGARNLYLYFTPLAICWFYGQDLRAWKYLWNKFTW